MIRRKFISLAGIAMAAVLALPSVTLAEKVQLTAAEIEQLLSGNTIDGDWGGAYKQYYREDGFTMYIPDGGDPSEGKWRANADNTYGSWWESTGWTDYKIVKDGDNYFWVDSEGVEYPFQVMEGKQISW